MAEFDIIAEYRRVLAEDPDMTMPVAAIESLVQLLARSEATTTAETMTLVASNTAKLKEAIPNQISLTAGTDLFARYLDNVLRLGSDADFRATRQHLLTNSRLFVTRAKQSRNKIAEIGVKFIRDGTTVLTNGGSRVVGALLKNAAEASKGIRFNVIYVQADSEGDTIVSQLRKKGVPVAVIGEGSVGYALDLVDLVIVGAEGVVENGGIISRLGTYQLAMLAKADGKPFYVVAETHKFVRLYPLGQYDLPIEQHLVDFTVENTSGKRPPDAVDFTPPHLISALISENGVLTPSAVSEELIKIWF